MKVQFLLIFLFYLFCTQTQVEGAVGLEKTDPKSCGSDCCGSRIGPMKYGEVKQPQGSCMTASCGGDGMIEYESCISISATPPCYVDKGDLSKPYPECCPQKRC